MDELVAAIDAIPARNAAGAARWLTRRTVAFALGAVFAVGGAAAVTGALSKRRAEVARTAAPASVPAKPRAIGLLDLPLPFTKSPEALSEYRRALRDRHDAIHAASSALLRAVQLDPEFAAAQLRLAFTAWQPVSTRYYTEAVRFRANLDERDLELLHAEEPLQMSSPPDLAEAERRYAALHAERPRDVEILMALASARARRDPVAGQAAFEEVLALDPTMAGAESGAAWSAELGGDGDAALRHYTRCVEMSPTAGRCLAGIASVNASKGLCEASAEQLGKLLVIQPDDEYVRLDMVNATLGAGRSRDEALAAVKASVATAPTSPAYAKTITSDDEGGEVDLWFGSFAEARASFLRLRIAYTEFGAHDAVLQELLGVAEETGDEAAAISLLKESVGVRATAMTDRGYDDVVLQALRRHRAMSEDAIAALRARWRAQAKVGGTPDWQVWLTFDAAPSLTFGEARDALAHAEDTTVPLRPTSTDTSNESAHVNAQLGRLLLLAGRYADAARRLEIAAYDCRPIANDSNSNTVLMVRAALDLGRAHEALGDVGGACVAYRRVLERWGSATPRSITANAARAAAKRLHCSN